MEVSLAFDIVMLVFVVLLMAAFSGLLQKVRALEATGRPNMDAAGSGPSAVATASFRDAIPSGKVASVLLVDAGCSSCEQAMEVFSEASTTSLAEDIEFFVLTDHDIQIELSTNVHLDRDLGAHGSLHPGWSPALMLIDADRGLISTEPAGSSSAVRAVLERSVSFARARNGASAN